jgi:predicted SAM-dependent methyltransferase
LWLFVRAKTQAIGRTTGLHDDAIDWNQCGLRANANERLDQLRQFTEHRLRADSVSRSRARTDRCEQHPTAQFIRFARDNEIKYANATKRIPLDSGTAHIVYSSHMLEHLDRQVAEAMRVVRPGGVLRLAVPDIRKLVQNYIATGDADEFIASTWMCAPRPRSLTESLRLLVLGPRHHNWMYDDTSLSKFLLSQGFVNPLSASMSG